MKLSALLAWLLVAALLLGSSTCSSSRPLAAADGGGDSKAWAGIGEKAAAPARRSLGMRTSSLPPSPFPNKMKATAMPVSPPPKI
ncbi:hypothetical protein E2562_039207 [Oryza meyeriana var. granulata]|uniref:Uncharacterized protein n=1 Tax=Oryza meyeriana var. granulata TaxID=110450 RepID=A0A6G1CZR4_9ORYZ|nr:hypothetical protein E2562_039207 [Oryza meyeriana var. granulata]